MGTGVGNLDDIGQAQEQLKENVSISFHWN